MLCKICNKNVATLGEYCSACLERENLSSDELEDAAAFWTNLMGGIQVLDRYNDV